MRNITIERVANGYIVSHWEELDELDNNGKPVFEEKKFLFEEVELWEPDGERKAEVDCLISMFRHIAFLSGYADNGFSKYNLSIGCEKGDEIEDSAENK